MIDVDFDILLYIILVFINVLTKHTYYSTIQYNTCSSSAHIVIH